MYVRKYAYYTYLYREEFDGPIFKDLYFYCLKLVGDLGIKPMHECAIKVK